MNRREKVVSDKAVEDGWEVLSSGYPDFLLYKEKDNEVIFVEVKSQLAKKRNLQGGELNDSQKRMHQVLKNLGLTVKTVHIK